MNKRMVNIRLDQEDLEILNDEANELKKETGDYRLGVATIIERIVKEYTAMRRKHPKQKPPTLFDAIERTDAGVPERTRSQRKASSNR